jgi:hypothetical protein
MQQASLRIFLPSLIISLMVGAFIGFQAPLADLWIFLILVILEITFSFDNAVINSKILGRMSPFWQQLFLTVGIIFAVFIVRFVLPIVIVMISSGHTFGNVVNMALHEPHQYAETLHVAAPIINAFGGSFLLMIGVSYFLDRNKDIHWLGYIERWLSRFGTYSSFKIIIMLLVALGLYATVDEPLKSIVLASSTIGIVLHMMLELFGEYFGSKQSSANHLVGGAAFASFLYLNVLDASFSLDGVIGAFAISTDVLLIMAGLGVGALWVRSLTIYLTRANTLSHYRYLEHGAHWAILVLGIIMLVKLYHIEPAEWFTGSIGLIFIATAVASSIMERKKQTKQLRAAK